MHNICYIGSSYPNYLNNYPIKALYFVHLDHIDAMEQILEIAHRKGFECLPIKRERTPLQGPPRTEGAFFDGDGYPVVVFDFNP